ncbi:hypothetical protein COCSADRAFT_39709 [Bipolaris sorokiniana ND90Pr]|uniref:Uncharacterized protein n=1 Tax=Cochliobolus sativus (strain ND90Pr / ATCC 201652) TaxID=665912 RepID=M2SVC5_COCSN|nr:uncharacterized protein COCSADRAFT_39709 [Bipolaris sorokiniana ND90Pr]EMD61001.1 hypothetical protein COCSADRAFT_39709 [Bipolaris sorokiniana ND90Pr]
MHVLFVARVLGSVSQPSKKKQRTIITYNAHHIPHFQQKNRQQDQNNDNNKHNHTIPIKTTHKHTHSNAPLASHAPIAAPHRTHSTQHVHTRRNTPSDTPTLAPY